MKEGPKPYDALAENFVEYNGIEYNMYMIVYAYYVVYA